jgi:hypothetical protein
MLNNLAIQRVVYRLLICGFRVRFSGGSSQKLNNLATFAFQRIRVDAPGMQTVAAEACP